jgi:hypothetical protein
VRIHLLEEGGEGLDRVRSGDGKHRSGLLEGQLGGLGVGRVLSLALVPAAAQVDDGRPPREAARDLGREARQLVVVNRERKLTDEVVRAGQRRT